MQRLVSLIIGGLLLVAATSKAWNVMPFLGTLGYILGTRHLPAMTLVSALVIVAFECVLGFLLITFRESRTVCAAVIAMLCVFSLVLLRIAVDPSAPPCNCFALIRSYQRAQHEAAFGLIRNFAMIWAVGWPWLQAGSRVDGKDGVSDVTGACHVL